MQRKVIFHVVYFSALLVASAFATGVVVPIGNLTISEIGSGLVFPDGTIQKTGSAAFNNISVCTNGNAFTVKNSGQGSAVSLTNSSDYPSGYFSNAGNGPAGYFTNSGNGTAGYFSNSGTNPTGYFSNSGTGAGGYFSSTGVAPALYAVVDFGYGNAAVFIGDVSVSGNAAFTGDVSVSGNAAFTGDVSVLGNLSKGGGSFKIDHPIDPRNKFLFHSFVESPDMMNIYNGTTITDAQGYATIILPAWFEALNKDFRYQLTVLDEGDSNDFVQAKVVRKIIDNNFIIRTSSPMTEVSWQVTGIRQDPYAEKHRIQVEVEKSAIEKGTCLHPEACVK